MADPDRNKITVEHLHILEFRLQWESSSPSNWAFAMKKKIEYFIVFAHSILILLLLLSFMCARLNPVWYNVPRALFNKLFKLYWRRNFKASWFYCALLFLFLAVLYLSNESDYCMCFWSSKKMCVRIVTMRWMAFLSANQSVQASYDVTLAALEMCSIRCGNLLCLRGEAPMLQD